MKKKGGAAEKVREEETTEGRCAGACAHVNDAMLSARRLQPCLSEQQCRHVEHESQLARVCQGPVLLCCVLQSTMLLTAEGKKGEE